MKQLERKEMNTVKGCILRFCRGISCADNQQPSPVVNIVDNVGKVEAGKVGNIAGNIGNAAGKF